MKKRAIVLVGGNSQIGNALVNGLSARLRADEIVYISREANQIESANPLRIENYSEFSLRDLDFQFDILAIVVSFGILQNSGDVVSDLRENIEVNVFQYLDVCAQALAYLDKHEGVELHVTSSVLADFSRSSVFAYSISKNTMEKTLRHLAKLMKSKNLRIFYWKFAFVATPMNADRSKSQIFTKVESIEKAANTYTRPGTYYLPRFAKLPSRILSHFPRITEKLR